MYCHIPSTILREIEREPEREREREREGCLLYGPYHHDIVFNILAPNGQVKVSNGS